MPKQDADAVLRELAQLIAPYVAEILEADDRRGQGGSTEALSYDDEGAAHYVSGLRQELTEYAIVFFETLSEPPHRVDARHLVALLGATTGREVAGLLTTPLKRHRERHGFPGDPWDEEEGPGGQRMFVDRDGNATRILKALLDHRARHHWTPNIAELLARADTRRPVPTSIYVWAPEYANFTAADDQTEQRASCLRTDRPGTRAVIYRAHERQGIVALFDVGEEPQPDPDWGYVAHGRVHVLDGPILREELLDITEVARIFEHIQGRRRIPASAQEPLKDLLVSRFPTSREAPAELPVFLPLRDTAK